MVQMIVVYNFSSSLSTGINIQCSDYNFCYIPIPYDTSGIRTSKTVNGVTTNYTTIDGRITSQNDGTNFLYFRYDSNNELVGVQINGTKYIYLKNLQGDVISMN